MINPDGRRFAYPEDRQGLCRKCGTKLVLLPNDKRHGYCFDCFDPLEF